MMQVIRFFLFVFLFLVSHYQVWSQANNDVKELVLWCDPLHNFNQVSNRQGILSILDKARDNGFDAIALVVKTTSGEVIFKSEIAPKLLQWNNVNLALDFDPVQIFIDESSARNLKIYAVFSVFSEGHMVERRGPIYAERPNWQSMVYVIDEKEPKVMPITEWGYGVAAFANPLLKEVQDYEIAVVTEFLKNYRVDAVIFDKARFNGIEADFSSHSKQQFQKFLGEGDKIHWWPDDVYKLEQINNEWQIVPGLLFQDWIEFRSREMRSFMKRMLDAVKQVDPTTAISSFVGAWYPSYYEYGVNWGSEMTIPEEDWSSRNYYKTAQAEMMDSIIAACFFPRVTIKEAEDVNADWWMSVEGASLVATEVVNKACRVEAALMADQFKTDKKAFEKALETALNLTDGLYIYDFSQIEKYDFWDIIKAMSKHSSQNRAAGSRDSR